MKALIISDIHANHLALQAIEKKENWDEVYCCGDLVDYGPFPMEVIEWCVAHQAKCVLGNHDAHVLNTSGEECDHAKAEKRFKWAHDNRQKLTPEAVEYLRSLPITMRFQIDSVEYQMQHQYDHAYGFIESIEQFNAFWKGEFDCCKERRMLFGHSHRQCVHMLSEKALWMNPGSASYRRPDDHDKRAHYMIIENRKIRFGNVAYDRTPLLDKAKDYLKKGIMLETDLQDAFFFFGNAATTREPLQGWDCQE